jgi:hypothetical protein
MAKDLLGRIRRMESKAKPFLLLKEGFTRVRKIIDAKQGNEFHICREITVEPGNVIKEKEVDQWERGNI